MIYFIFDFKAMNNDTSAMAKDLCWNRYAYNRKFPVNYLITEKFIVDLSPLQLKHQNNPLLNVGVVVNRYSGSRVVSPEDYYFK